MRGISGGRTSSQEIGSGSEAQSQCSQTIYLDQKEMPKMRKRTARAKESMRLRPCFFLNMGKCIDVPALRSCFTDAARKVETVATELGITKMGSVG